MAGGIAKVLVRFTKQRLVYWQYVGADNFGKPSFADPVELRCRWEDIQQEILNKDGRRVLSHAYIILSSPAEEQSLVFLGTLVQWQAMPTYPAIPTVAQGCREVLKLKTTPDINAQSYVYEAYV